MTYLKIYASSKLECQKTGYFNKWQNSVLWQASNTIPAWIYDFGSTLSSFTATAYLQVLNRVNLENGNIVVDTSEDISGLYTVSTSGSKAYAAQSSGKPLEETNIYRLYIDTSEGDLYSEIFKKAS